MHIHLLDAGESLGDQEHFAQSSDNCLSFSTSAALEVPTQAMGKEGGASVRICPRGQSRVHAVHQCVGQSLRIHLLDAGEGLGDQEHFAQGSDNC